MILMLIIEIIWIILIICNYFINNVFKPELSKVAARRAAQAPDDESCAGLGMTRLKRTRQKQQSCPRRTCATALRRAAGRLWRRVLELRVGFWV